MFLTTLSIRRPLIVLIGIGALLAFGVLALTRLGVELFPSIDVPVVVVTTPYPGAGPDAVDTLVTQKIEDAVSSVSEIDSIESTSVEGLSTVAIKFTDTAKDSPHLVEQKVNAIRNDLPTDTKTPTVTMVDGNSNSIMQLTLGGDEDLGQLQQRAEDVLKKAVVRPRAACVARAPLGGGGVRCPLVRGRHHARHHRCAVVGVPAVGRLRPPRPRHRDARGHTPRRDERRDRPD